MTIKDYIYLAILIALGVAFIKVYEDGKASAIAADAKVVQAQKVHTNEVQNLANTLVEKALDEYKISEAKPVDPVTVPSLVCIASTPRPGTVPSHGASTVQSNDASDLPKEDNQGFNPAPAAIEHGKEADDQIKLLQAYIQACQKAKICK